MVLWVIWVISRHFYDQCHSPMNRRCVDVLGVLLGDVSSARRYGHMGVHYGMEYSLRCRVVLGLDAVISAALFPQSSALAFSILPSTRALRELYGLIGIAYSTRQLQSFRFSNLAHFDLPHRWRNPQRWGCATWSHSETLMSMHLPHTMPSPRLPPRLRRPS